jgi:hypothetical protein
VHKDKYRHYKDNITVGVIEKAYIKPIFDRYLVCFVTDIDFANLDLFTERLVAILKSYVELDKKEEAINGVSHFYGTAVIEKLKESCFAGNDLNNGELITGTKYILRMKIFMKECLIKLAENKSFVTTADEIINSFDPSIETWANLINILVKRSMKKRTLLDKNLIEYFNDLIRKEKVLIKFISDLLKVKF